MPTFFLGRVNACADDVMGFVADAPRYISLVLSVERRRVGQGRNVLADLFGLEVVFFELHPFGFIG